LSARNLWNMRNFYCANRGHEIMQQAVAEIPWGHNLLIINKLKDPEERLWYVQETINNGWSRNVLLHQIETHLYQRQALNPKTNNFARTLPPDQSDLIEQTLKDPYIFDFLGTGKKLKERELEEGLVASLKALFLELGSGFAFMGSQFPLDVEGDIFKVDLLFYHYQLRRLVAIDLKTGPFRPEHTGKMNFYLSALDEMIKHPEDLPSLGIILCRKKKKLVAEYSLRDMGKPVGITEYRLSSQLPEEFEGKLPGPEELERLLEGFEKDKEEEELHKG
jgi:predicted nuclease of restriction endonuclease-like (RecB) superfamily